jgi:tripartite-type tricarboxylate transporter receptor subunit TctC
MNGGAQPRKEMWGRNMKNLIIDRRAFVGALLAAPAMSVLPQSAAAQAAFPNKPIKLIVGFAAGGGNDLFARLVGQRLSELLGQPVVVENRIGAGGRLAVDFVAKQAPDGYTLAVAASGAMAVAAAIFPKLPYHPTRSFVPLTQIASFPLILCIPADHPAKSVKELAAWAKANPTKANFATSSPAFTITVELLKLKTGMPGVAIPYKSSNEMMLSVAAGTSLYSIADGPPTVPLINAKKIRAIAVTGSKRSPELPDVPSMAEAGFPEVDVHLWSGFFAPAKTPPDVVAKLEAALRSAINDAGVTAKLKAMAVEPGGGPGAAFKAMIEADIKKFAEVVKAANLKFE